MAATIKMPTHSLANNLREAHAFDVTSRKIELLVAALDKGDAELVANFARRFQAFMHEYEGFARRVHSVSKGRSVMLMSPPSKRYCAWEP